MGSPGFTSTPLDSQGFLVYFAACVERQPLQHYKLRRLLKSHQLDRAAFLGIRQCGLFSVAIACDEECHHGLGSLLLHYDDGGFHDGCAARKN